MAHHVCYGIAAGRKVFARIDDSRVAEPPMSAWQWSRDDIGKPFLEQMPRGRWATEAEIAAPIVFLLSDAGSLITGVSLPVGGGSSSR